MWNLVGAMDMGNVNNNIQTIINGKSEVKLATHVLQFVYHGFGGFRWPVGYFASTSATASQLNNCILNAIDILDDFGFTIDYIMMDGASSNRAVTKMLVGEDPRMLRYAFPNVFNVSNKIFIIQDIKHVLKKIRNGLHSSRKENISDKGRYLTKNGKHILWDQWIAAYHFNNRDGFRIHHKLTPEHILELTPANKMRNHLATEVLDMNMLRLMRHYSKNTEHPEEL